MYQRFGRFPFALILVVSLLGSWCSTGQPVGGSDGGDIAIRAYWEAAGTGNPQQSIAIYGYPISEAFDEQSPPAPAGDGQTHRVQYFERFRLEYHPENPVPNNVQLGLLGVSELDRSQVAPSSRTSEPAGVAQPDVVNTGNQMPPAATWTDPEGLVRLQYPQAWV